MWDRIQAQIQIELEQLDRLLNTYRPLLVRRTAVPPSDGPAERDRRGRQQVLVDDLRHGGAAAGRAHLSQARRADRERSRQSYRRG